MKVSFVRSIEIIFVVVFLSIVSGCSQPGNSTSEIDETSPIIVKLSGTDERMLGEKLTVDICEWEYDSVNKSYRLIKYVGCVSGGRNGYYEKESSMDITNKLDPDKYYSLNVKTYLPEKRIDLVSKLIIDDNVKELARLEREYFIIDLKRRGTYEFSFAFYDNGPSEGYTNFVFNVTRTNPSTDN